MTYQQVDPFDFPNRYRYPPGLHHVSSHYMSYRAPPCFGPSPAFLSYPAAPPGAFYGTGSPPPGRYFPGSAPQPAQMPPGAFGYAGFGWSGFPPGPPPPYAPPEDSSDDEYRKKLRKKKRSRGPYKTVDVATLKFHVIEQIPSVTVDMFFAGAVRSQPSATPYELPKTMKLQAFFNTIGARGSKVVVEEAVEEGNGVWIRGAKIKWGDTKRSTIGDVKWMRGHGLCAAEGEPIWVLCRKMDKND